MKSQLKWLAMATCAVAIGSLWAAPSAGWFDFSGGVQNEDGTTTFVGDNAAYSLVVTGGTSAPDGSYIQLGSPAQEATETKEAVPATTGSISLTYPDALASGMMVSIIADVQYPSAVDNVLMEVKLNNDHSIYLKTLLDSTDSKMKFVWKNSPNKVYGTPVAWSPTTRQRVTFAYRGPSDSGDMSQGTTLYLGDAPTAADSDATNLYSSDQSLKAIKIGDGASGLKIYGLYIYTTKLTSASAVTSEITAFKAQQTATFATKKSTTISGETNWSNLAWNPSAPTSEEAAVLDISSGANTLTLNNDSAIALTGLFTQGDGTLSIAGSRALSANVTTLNTHLDLTNAPETLSLGSVVLGSGKTLTVTNTSFWSALRGSDDSVVRYTAPSGTMAPLGNVIVELAASEPAADVTLPSSGGNYRVSSGTYTRMTLERTSTATTYDFTGGDMTFGEFVDGELSNGEFSFGTATATISGGTIRAPKMVTVQDANGRSTSVTQTGGDIILSGKTDGSTTENAVLMFGHWRNGTSTYTLSGGSITAASGGMRFGNDSPSTLNLSGTGILKVKGIWGKGEQTCALNLSGGKLSIGSDGFKSIARLTVTATGGEINAFANNTIAQAITVNGPTTFSADADCTMTVSGSLSGTGALTIGTATATGAVNLGTQRPKIAAIADGATLKLTATDLESAGRAIILPTTATSAIAKERFSVVNSTGVAMTVTGTSLADGQLTLTLEASEATLILGDLSDVWSGETAWPNTGNVTINAAQLTEDKTVTIPAPAEGTRALTQVTVVGNTTAKVTLVVSSGVSIATLVPYGYVRVDVDTVNALTTAPVVPAGATLEVIAGSTSTDTATLSKAISGAGTFAKGGAGVLTLGADITITTGGGSIVQSGTLKFAAKRATGETLGTITTSTQPNNYTSNAMGDVRVCENAVLDLNGRADLWLRTITLETGATYKNGSTSEVSNGSRQLRAIVLEGDAFVEATSNFGLLAHNYDATTLTLNGHTLTKKGSGSFWLTKCTISGGTLKVKEGAFIGNSNVTPCTISGAVTFERASDATGTARFDFTQATATDSKFLTIASGATLTTAGPVVADGIKLGYTVLTGNLVANNNVSIAHLQISANKTLTGTGTITVADTTLNSRTLTTQAHLVLAPSTTTYTESSPKVIAAPIVVGSATSAQNKGSLTTRGNLRLTSTSNIFYRQITVESGVLEATCAKQGIKGGLLIKKEGTFKAYNISNALDDRLAYGVEQTIDVYGKLDMNGTRWTLGSGTGSEATRQTINVYRGATIQGAGQQANGNTTYGAFDANISATLNFKRADVPADEKNSNEAITFASSLRARTPITLNVESGVTVNFTGNRSRDTNDSGADASTIAKTGAGKFILNNGARFLLNGACSGPIQIETGSTLTLAGAAHTSTISGNGALVIGDGTNVASLTTTSLGSVEEDGTFKHTGSIKVQKNATLTLNNTVATTLSGELSGSGAIGSGAITLGGTGEVNVTNANGFYNGTITINSGATLTNAGSSASVPFGKGSIENNGTVKLMGTADNEGGQLPPTSGSGKIVFCAGSTSRIPGEITTTGTVTFEPANGKGAAAAVVTFVKNATDFNEKVASISGASVVVGEGVTLAKDVASSPLITIPTGTTLSGSGAINVPVTLNGTLAAGAEITFGKAISVGEGATLSGKATFAAGSVLSSAATFTGDVSFEAGATIDASSATIAFNAKVTLPETGVVKVKPNGSYATIIMANLGGLRASAFVFDESVAETYAGYCLGTPLYSPSSEEKTQFLMLLTKPTVAAGTSDEVVSAIARAVADDYGFSNWQLTSAEAIGNATLDGAALFGHVTALDEQDSKVAKVSYDFGVDWLTVTADDKVVIRAKVASSAVSGVSATILSSTTVKVQQLTGTNAEGNPVWADVTSAELTSTEIEALGQTSDGATRYLSIERPSGLATFSYRVVATDAASN